MTPPRPAAAPAAPAPMAPAPVDDSPAALAVRLRMAVARVHRRARTEAVTDGDDVSASRFAALATIQKRGPITLGELAAEEQVQPPSMTRIVARLEGQGLVERAVDPDDRRVARVEITPAGAELLAITRTRRNAFLAQRIERFTDDERVALAAALPLLERILEDD
ncbi:MAG: MarR family transcriptional regulator [Acidimicrobiia bacterium]